MLTKRTLNSVLTTIVITFLMSPVSVTAQEKGVTVFRDLSFGDTKKEARLAVLRDELFSVPIIGLGEEALSPEGDVDLRIESVSLDLVFFFNQDGLYRLDATGESVAEEAFDSTFSNRLDTLRKTMIQRFGEPTMTQRQQPKDVGTGQFKTVAYWSGDDLEGSREIWVGINGSESSYEPTLIIQDPDRAEAAPLESEPNTPPTISVDDAPQNF